jgi:hypothetical protein
MSGSKNNQSEKAKKAKQMKNKSKKPSIYKFNKETNKWEVINPDSSIAYNFLSRDEWGWLD